MKKYEGVSITVTDDLSSYGYDATSEIIEKWENFLVEKFGVDILVPGGDRMSQGLIIDDHPEGFDEEEFNNDVAEAWEEFCSKN